MSGENRAYRRFTSRLGGQKESRFAKYGMRQQGGNVDAANVSVSAGQRRQRWQRQQQQQHHHHHHQAKPLNSFPTKARERQAGDTDAGGAWFWGEDPEADDDGGLGAIAAERTKLGPNLGRVLTTIVQSVKAAIEDGGGIEYGAGEGNKGQLPLFTYPARSDAKYYPPSVHKEDPHYFVREVQKEEDKAKRERMRAAGKRLHFNEYPFDRTARRRRPEADGSSVLATTTTGQASLSSWVAKQDKMRKDERKRYLHLLAVLQKEQCVIESRRRERCFACLLVFQVTHLHSNDVRRASST